jgi:LuxR family transcriptional regulator, maltose regulon positive regulatory protein
VPRPRVSPEAAAAPGLPVPRHLPEALTQRELTILRFLGTSMSAAEIADELFLSVNTVKTHIASIYRKLTVSRRREAVQRARELELI